MEDLQAIRRLHRGDLGGLECLITRYQAKAIRVAFLITQDEPLAEDVVQEVFVRLSTRRLRLQEGRPFEPYFLRSVVNASLNRMEREKRGGYLDRDRETILEKLLEQGASVEEQVEFNAVKAQILYALAELSPRQRTAIVQRYYLEMSEKEISEAMAAPVGTIKWLLNEARNRLRVLLRPERMAE